MIGCIRCHGPLDGNGDCPFCDAEPLSPEMQQVCDETVEAMRRAFREKLNEKSQKRD